MKPPRTYSGHALHALKVRVMARGLAAIDQRTTAAQLLGGLNDLAATRTGACSC